MIHLDLSVHKLNIETFKEQLEAFSNIRKSSNKLGFLAVKYNNLSEFIHSMISLNETRFYCLNNTYLNSIQAGIQSAHGMAELSSKYYVANHKVNSAIKGNSEIQTLNNSITNKHDVNHYSDYLIYILSKCIYKDKTMIVLNGGDHESLCDSYSYIENLSNHMHLPFAKFHESDRALNGALTNIAMCISESSYLGDFKQFSKDLFKEPKDPLNNKNYKVDRDLLLKDINLLQTHQFVLSKLKNLNKDVVNIILNSTKAKNINDIMFFALNDKIYLITKYDLVLSQFINKFRLFS